MGKVGEEEKGFFRNEESVGMRNILRIKEIGEYLKGGIGRKRWPALVG